MLITPWSLNARIPGFSSRSPQDVAMKTPDYDALQKKANQAGCFGIILSGEGSVSECFISGYRKGWDDGWHGDDTLLCSFSWSRFIDSKIDISRS